MKKRFNNILEIRAKKNGTTLLIVVLMLILISSGLVACARNEVKSESDLEASAVNNTQAINLPSENISDKPGTEVNQATLPSESRSDSSEERSLSSYLNSAESVWFQETVWQFAKAYFSSDKDEIKKYLAEGVEPEVSNENTYDKLSRLVLKWNPEELSTDNVMDVQYEFVYEGDDSCTYLGMILKYQNDKWLVQEYYLEK